MRTENYREIMRLQQESADPLAKMDVEEDTAAAREAFEKLTRLPYKQQMENFLSYGRWDLTERDVERLQKDEEMKQRVGNTILLLLENDCKYPYITTLYWLWCSSDMLRRFWYPACLVAIKTKLL